MLAEKALSVDGRRLGARNHFVFAGQRLIERVEIRVIRGIWERTV